MSGLLSTLTRAHLSLTEKQLATLLGVHEMTVSKWERFVAFPTPHQHALLCYLVDVTVNPATLARARLALDERRVVNALGLLLEHAGDWIQESDD